MSNWFSSSAAGTISGTVYLDGNGNGAKDSGEAGVASVTVNAYNATNGLAGSAVTDGNGIYTLNSSSNDVRLEFVYPSQYFPTPGSATNNTVRLVSTGATGVNLGLQNPAEYCNTNPDVLVNCYVFGDQVAGAYKNSDVLLTFPYNAGAIEANTTPVADYLNPTTHAWTVTAKELGPTWGIAYRKTTQHIFAGAYMKRHIGFGPGGPGAIYRMTYPASTPTVFATLPTGTDPHDTANWFKDYKTISGQPYSNTHDAVGKLGLADLEILEDPSNPANDKLFAVNLYDRKLYVLNANTGAIITSTNSFLSLPGAAQGGAAVDIRPFGLGKRNGKIFIGLVNTGESVNTWPGAGNGVYDAGEPFRDNGNGGGIADNNLRDGGEFYKDIGVPNRTMLRGYVYEYDPATNTLASSPSVEWNLNFQRGAVGNGHIAELWDDPSQLGQDVADQDGYRSARWNPWTSAFKTVGLNNPENRFVFPQPAVADIEFDATTGAMIIAMWDRAGAQGGNQTQSDPNPANTTLFQGQTGGDIHCAAPANTPGKWNFEVNGSCGGLTTAGANDRKGPGGGQFYFEDAFPLWQGSAPPFTPFTPAPNSQHMQVVIGGLTHVPGSAEVLAAVFDPIPVAGNFEDQGIHVYSNTDGSLKRAYLVVDGSPVGGVNPGPAAKDAGLGDLELICPAQPVEIGNTLWKDTDLDGLQDPGEAPLAGITVTLYDQSGVKVATTTTDSNGLYKFNNTNVDTTGNNGASGFTGLKYGGTYTIIVGEGAFVNGELIVGTQKCRLTLADVTTGNGNDENDSDGVNLAPGQPGALAALAGYPSATVIAGGSGGNKQNFDFGFTPVIPYSIGNTVWFDTNNNGQIEMTELGKDGVLVELFLDADNSGTLSGAEQTPIARQLTKSGGHYLFTQTTNAAGIGTGTGLNAGTYFVGISPFNFNAAGAPATIGGAPFTAGMLRGYLSSNTSISNAGVITDPQLASNGLTNSDQDNFDDGLKQSAGFYANGVLSQALVLVSPEPIGEITKPSGTTGGATPGHNNTVDGTAGGVAISDNASNLTVDFGFYSQCLGNVVFEDNGATGGAALNGLKDGGEPGLNGVTLKLYAQDGLTEINVGPDGILGTADDAAGGVVTATLSGVAGSYQFCGLPAGSYKVQVTIPAGLNSTLDTAGTPNPDGNLDNDDNLVGGAGGVQFSPAISLVAGAEPTIDNTIALTTNNTLDFGVARAYSLGNRVWKDLDNSGTLNGAEAGVQGVVLKLLKGNLSPATDLSGAAVANQTTDASGYYRFDNLPAGDYIVEVLASNFIGTGKLVGCLSSGTDAGDPDTDVDDSDDNGIGITPDATNGIRSAAVTLGDGNGAAEPTTDNDPATNPGAGETVNAQSNRTVDFGFIPTFALGNRVWKDLDNSGTLNGAEAGVQGVVLRLLKSPALTQATDANGVLVANATTDANGYYRFDNLLSGDYVVEVLASNFVGAGKLVGCVSSSTDEAAPNSDVDSNDNGIGVTPNATTGIRSAAITLGPAENSEPTTETDRGPTDPAEPNGMTNLTLDFGFMPIFSLGNRVWKDVDNNGLLNGAEAGLNGVVLRLLKSPSLTQATDAAGALVADQTTANGGYYRFDNLLAGDYVIEVRASNFTGAGVLVSCVSSSPTASDPDTSPADSDDNGVGVAPDAANGIRSLPVTLGPAIGSEPTNETDLGSTDPAEPNGATNLTVDFGFTGLYSLGNRVWKDMDDSGTLNGAEAGINGVVLKLLTGNLTPANDIYGNPVANQTTAGGGYYRFDNLAAGDYVVEVVAANFTGTGALTGCNSSTTDAGDPDTDVDDSDDNGIGISPDVTNGIRSAAVTLGEAPGNLEPTNDNDPAANPQTGEAANNQSNRTVDFGFRPVMVIGNLVWKDQNNNGKYEAATEVVLPNISLRLYQDNGDNTFNAATDTLVQTILSNSSGIYQFSNLLPGNYFVWVDKAEFAPGGDLFGCFSSTGNNISNSDIDNEDDGVDTTTPDTTGVASPMVTLVFQNEPTNDGDGNNANQTIDFGFYTPLAVGNLVWKDLNNDGNYQVGEPLIQNVKLNLIKDANGNKTFESGTDTIIDSKLTNAAGEYGFTGLLPGDYFVQLDASNFAPAGVLYGCVSSSGNGLADNNTDNNDDGVDNTNPAANGIVSTFIALLGGTEPSSDGRSNMTVDFGITPTFSLGNRVWKDLDNSGTLNGLEAGVNGVTLRLLKAPALTAATDVFGNPVPNQLTANGGYYRFDNLAGGDYVVEVVAANFTGTGALAACISSGPVAVDPDNDADNDDNGVGTMPSPTNGIRSLPLTLGPNGNSEPNNETDRSPTDPAEPNANTNLTLDFGFLPAFSLGNRVWKDLDNSGTINVADGPTPGIDGVTVRLLKSDRSPAKDVTGANVADQVTAGGGYYRFDNLPAGDYLVEIIASNFTGVLSNCQSSNVGEEADPNANGDSNDNGTVTRPDGAIDSGIVTLGPAPGSEPTNEADRSATDPVEPNGNTNLTVDFGFSPKMTLGNLIWKDYDNDGLKDSDEPGIDGVQLDLYLDRDNSGGFSSGDSPAVANTVTAGGGLYKFENLQPGKYVVNVTGANFSGTGVLTGCLSSTTTVADPNSDLNDDDNGLDNAAPPTNGIQSGVVTLLGNSEPDSAIDTDGRNGNLTLDFGFYAPVNLGNLIWKDYDNDGLKDGDEPGIDGVTVELLKDADGNGSLSGAELTAVSSQITAGGGLYNFSNLLPGKYAVRVAASNFNATTGILKDCKSSTTSVANADGNINDDDNGVDDPAPATNGITSGVVTLKGNDEPDTPVDGDGRNGNLTVDFGFYAPVALGNLVFKDFNNNGLKDGTEPGIDGVAVELLRDTNNNGAIDGAETTAVATQITAGGGLYKFTNLLPGNYAVRVAASNFSGAGILKDCVSSTTTTANADGNADNDDNGIDNAAPATNGISSGVVTLKGNDEPDTPADGDDRNSNSTVDFGFYAPLNLGNLVWKDQDNDGLKDGDEPGIDGVTVELLRDANSSGVIDANEMTAVATLVTAGGGLYNFQNLLPGNYAVRLAASNWSATGVLKDCRSSIPTTANADGNVDNDDNGIDSTAFATTGISSNVVTLSGDSEPDTAADGDNRNGNLTVDFGVYPLMSLGNLVWKDYNNDGLKGANEPGIDGVVVELLKDTNTSAPIATVTTAGGGLYNFANLSPGTYFVRVAASNFNATNGVLKDCNSSTVSDPADNNENNDDNGIDNNAPATNGITSGAVVLKGATEPDTPVDGDGTNGNATIDFGFYPYMNLGNLIWKDYDNDGLKDGDEPGVDGVIVELLKDADNNGSLAGAELTAAATLTTSGGGLYNFQNLTPGNYAVRAAAANFSGTGKLVGCHSSTVSDPADNNEDNDDNGIDNNAPATNGVTSGLVNLLGNAEVTNDGDGPNGNLTVDLGFYPPMNLGNLVWKDLDDDGIKDSDEPGIDGVTVELLRDADGNGSINGSEATPITSQVTAGGGKYNFTNLLPGGYVVRVAASNFSGAGLLVGCTTSTVTAADPNNDVDNDDNGLHNATPATSGISSGLVMLKGESEPDTAMDGDAKNGNLTVDFGFFFPMAVGNLVWKDYDNDGLKGTNEPTINGVTMELLKDANNNGTLDTAELTAVATQVTAGGGLYKFAGLVPGNYFVRVAASNFGANGILKDCVSSSVSDPTPNNNEDNDDNGIDNPAPATNGIVTGVITLKGNDEPDTAVDGDDKQSNSTVDFGFFAPLTLGNLVWKDANNNGKAEAGEPGVDGVIVELLRDANNNGTLDASELITFKTVTTAGGGQYKFEQLVPGGYFVRIGASNFTASGALAGCLSSTVTSATPNDDKDNDDNGIDNTTLSVTGVRSGLVTLLGDSEPDTPVDGDNKHGNLTVDFGFIINDMVIGNAVWKDKDGNGTRGANEPGIANVKLTLFRDNGDGTFNAGTDTQVATANSDSTGAYKFTQLYPATYFVRVDNSNFTTNGPLADCVSTKGNPSPNNDVDNDDNGSDNLNPSVTPPVSGAIILVQGTEPTNDGDGANGNLTVDFGFFTPLTFAVQDPATCIGPGSVLQITATVTNTSDSNQPNNATDEFVAQLPATLVGLPNGATATINGAPAGTIVVTANKVTWNGAIPGNTTLTIKYNVQIANTAALGVQFCILNTAYFDADLNGTNEAQQTINYCDELDCTPLGPGQPIANGSSVLIFPAYTSSATNPNAANTQVNITNTSPDKSAALHLFFVDGDTCSVADSFMCLTANQTASFVMSDLDPGTNGYLMAVAVDPRTGCPTNFNYLVGDEYVKYDSGHADNLAANGVTALAPSEELCNGTTSTAATLKFDGVNYTALPRVLALSSLPSRADGNDTLLVLNRIGGNLATKMDAVNDFFGVLYDDVEKAYSFSGRGGACQFRSKLDGAFPRTTPRLDTIIPAGRSGWLKLWSATDAALIGTAFNRNGNAASQANAFSGGQGLHTLRTTSAATVSIPVFPPSC